MPNRYPACSACQQIVLASLSSCHSSFPSPSIPIHTIVSPLISSQCSSIEIFAVWTSPPVAWQCNSVIPTATMPTPSESLLPAMEPLRLYRMQRRLGRRAVVSPSVTQKASPVQPCLPRLCWRFLPTPLDSTEESLSELLPSHCPYALLGRQSSSSGHMQHEASWIEW